MQTEFTYLYKELFASWINLAYI